jgi:ubiquinone/menaquinone biosynthesis C-methylase UbiE
MPTLSQNRYWDIYKWPDDGDEWTDQAAFCGVPYPLWKQYLVESFIVSNVGEASTVLEIAVGHGRWTPPLAEIARLYIGVDMNRSCVNFCQRRFLHLANVEFHENDGRSLGMIGEQTIDFVWSFDSFVHLESNVTDAYMAEIARVLLPGGRCCIHHPGKPTEIQRARGLRSMVEVDTFALIAKAHGLHVVSQVDSWGPDGSCNTRLFADYITTLQKPPAST